MSETIDADAEVIDVPETMSAPAAWLASKRGEVEKLAGEYTPFTIEDADGYRDAKRQRAALRKDIAAIDGERKDMTRSIEQAVKAFRDGCKTVLEPLTSAEEGYKAELSAYEQRVKDERAATLRACYEDGWPDLSRQARWPDVLRVYGEKWLNATTSQKKAVDELNDAACEIAENLDNIAAASEGAERMSNQADYLRDLDYSRHLRDAQAREARRREIERAEREAREWAAQFHAEQQAPEGEQAAPEPQPTGQAQAVGRRRKVFVFEVDVPEESVPAFIDAMKALGDVHGHKTGERNE